MCKLDVKNVYSFIFTTAFRKGVMFGSGNLCEFLCSCFGFRTTSRIFTKFPKIQMSIPRRINIQIEIYLGNMLLISQTIKQILLSRDTVIFLHPYNFEFVLNLKKSIVNPVQKIEFHGITINSLEICLSLPQKKVLRYASSSSDTIQSNKTVRSFWFNNSGSVASSGKFLIFLATTNKNIKNNSMRRHYCKNSFELSSDGITEQ